MNPYEYTVCVPAQSKEEATAKLQAACTLIQKLSAKELTKMAQVVSSDPVKTALAKKYLGL